MDSLKAFVKANIWLLLVAVALVVVLIQFVDPAPPREIVIATGAESGRYFELAQRLERELRKEGVSLRILTTAGSIDNLHLLTADDKPVSIAFVQSGMEEVFDSGENILRSLGSLYYEPIWLFYRDGQPVHRLFDLAGRRLSIGALGSGTQAVARFLLRENGLHEPALAPETFEFTDAQATEALLAGEIDAAFFMMSAASAAVRDLASQPGIDFLDMRRAESYRARYPFLSSVLVSEGLLDLASNVPARDKSVLAATATVVVNDAFHPALTPLVLEALRSALGQWGAAGETRPISLGRQRGLPAHPRSRALLPIRPTLPPAVHALLGGLAGGPHDHVRHPPYGLAHPSREVGWPRLPLARPLPHLPLVQIPARNRPSPGGGHSAGKSRPRAREAGQAGKGTGLRGRAALLLRGTLPPARARRIRHPPTR